MKKHLLSVLAVLICLCMIAGCSAPTVDTSATGPASASSASASPSESVVGVTALAHVNPVYHQIAAFFIEYSSDVLAPGTDGYKIEDFATSNLKEAYDRYPSCIAPITAVYTNSVPEVRDDKTSVPGKYVVIEIESTKNCVPNKDGLYMPNQNACMATWRLNGENCEWLRTDYSGLLMTQNVDIKDASGNVVAKHCTLPTLQAKDVYTPELDRFQNLKIDNFDGKNNSIYYTLYVPADYDKSKKYPLVFNSTGNGGRLNYKQQDADGNFVNIGAVVSRDRVAVAFTEYEPESIVVSIQTWRNQPEEWQYSDVDAALYLLDYMEQNYSVDTNRVYALSSSYGGMLVSNMLNKRPDAFAAYVQCNSCWSAEQGWVSTYAPEVGEERVSSFANETYASAQPRLDASRLGDITAAKEMLKPIADAGVKVWVWHAVNDETIPFKNGISTYEALVACYKDKGLADDEISKLVKLQVLEDSEYWAVGVAERHACSKMAVMHTEMFQWLFSQTKG